MKKKTWHSFVKSHNLVNRIYDMLDYFHCFDEVKNVELAKNQIKNKIRSIYYVETLAKYFDDKKNKFTRRDIVTYVANQDGGAHVDPELDESYATLTKMNSLGWTDYNGNKPLNNPAYQAIRTIANEVLYSIAISASGLKNRKKQKGKEFEMRIVDNFGRRYKWSKTEITCSLETMELVFQDKVEKRTLYIDEYKNGSKVEYVGP